MSTAGLTRRQVLAAAAARPSTRPNFLFILADDHAGYVLGADGNRQAPTPNLDRLASEGTRFVAHFCNSPVCTPSRQSFFTGQMPHSAGVTRLPTPLAEGKPTLARQMKRAGYQTAVFGEMHFNRPAVPGLHGFDTLLTEAELTPAWKKAVNPRPVPPGIRTKPEWHPFRDPARIWLNADKLPYPNFDADMRSRYLLSQATSYLEAHRSQPFALWVSFQEPHSPYDFPIEDRDRFAPARFAVPRVGPEDAGQIPLIFRELSEAHKQGIIASYYTSVGYLDRNVGSLLQSLRHLGLERDTLVVYMADHGYCLGHHGRFEKHCGYDPALRVPLLLRWPGRIPHRTVTGMTEHIDVPPTILDLLSLDPLPVTHGQNLLGATPRQFIFSEYLENEEAYVRTDRWKFIFCSGRRRRDDGYVTDNPTPGRYVRLFDLHNDPGEFSNVAARHGPVVDSLSTKMLDRFRTTHPEAAREPQRLSRFEALEWYVRPRDV